MVTFSTLWDNIVNGLKNDFGELGVNQDKIKHGVIEFDGKGQIRFPAAMEPPYIYVYMIPDTQKLYENSTSKVRHAEISILIVAAAKQNAQDAVKEVVTISEAVEKVIADHVKFVYPIEPLLDIPIATPTVTRGVINFQGKYISSKDA